MTRRLTEEVAQADPCARPQPEFVPGPASINETETEYYAGAAKLEGLPAVARTAVHGCTTRPWEPEANPSASKWKKGMKMRSLKVNTRKTEVMRCQVSRSQVEDSGQFSCSVCRNEVGCNSILCEVCHDKRVHTGAVAFPINLGIMLISIIFNNYP